MPARKRVAKTRPVTELDPESLFAIPLVRAAFTHETLHPRARAVDARWQYGGVLERTLTGFAPLGGPPFFAARSRTADWVRDPTASARPANSGDHLVYEVLFCVHDFLHAWAFAALGDLAPEVGPSAARSAVERDELAFVHLVTEAAATVGLDYWFLCTREPHEICDVGTTRMPLTTPYHERYAGEYRRFNAKLAVQDPKFFVDMARFYCTGRFVGFTARDLSLSPRLSRWLTHEVGYGQRQREYIREWLAFQDGASVAFETRGTPIACDGKWHREAMDRVAIRLWALVKEGRDAVPQRIAPSKPARSLARTFDPRFVNLAALTTDAIVDAARAVTDLGALRMLCDQLIGLFDYDDFDAKRLPALRRAREARDFPAVHSLLCDVARVPSTKHEPRTLFLLG